MHQQQRDPNLPTLELLRSMQPDEIGSIALPYLLRRMRDRSSGFIIKEMARSIAERGIDKPYGQGLDDYASLIAEGLDFLNRAGMLVINPQQTGADFYRLSRAGERAAAAPSPMFGTVAGLEARKLLHPLIAEAALGMFERGQYDESIFAAFKRLEVETNRRAGTREHGKDAFYKTIGKDKPLTPPPHDEAEALSLREVFAGSYGAFRNPATHRDVNDNPAQVMRVLIMASALYYVLESMPEVTP